MNAKKCDMCGTFYDETFEKKTSKKHYEVFYYKNGHRHQLDLCNDCQKRINELFGKGVVIK